MQQNDQRPVTGLDVMQVLIADRGVTLPKLDPDVRQQAGGGHQDLRGVGDLGARLRLPVWISKNVTGRRDRRRRGGRRNFRYPTKTDRERSR